MPNILTELVPTATIGGKIKKLRKHRGLTQEELGLLCGFPKESARIRINQYENNKKTPKKNVIIALANALQIDPYSIYETDLYIEKRAKHVLFELEDLYGIHPIEINGTIYLTFSHSNDFFEKDYFLSKWHEMYEKCKDVPSDNNQSWGKKQKLYDLWRYEYPLNEPEAYWQKQNILRLEKERLENELEQINKALNSTEQ